jgi:hypothetical protein
MQDEPDGPDDVDDGPPQPPRPWSTTAQTVAAVLWPSFLAACMASVVAFAIIDPELIQHATTPPLEVSRMTGYGIGFFFFWFVTTVSSAVSVYLLRTPHPGAAADEGRGPQP